MESAQTIDHQWMTGYYACTVEYYYNIKNEIPSFAKKWIQLETITLSEVSHSAEHKYHIDSLTCGDWYMIYKKCDIWVQEWQSDIGLQCIAFVYTAVQH